MKLGDILDSPKAHHVNGRPIDFIVIGTDSQGQPRQSKASARLRFVSEQERADLYAKADAEAIKRYGGSAPLDRQIEERNYHLLYAALRDEDAPGEPFAASVKQLRSSFVLTEAKRVFAAYEAWLEEEFPDHVTSEDMAKLVEEAKKKSLFDLFTSCGYRQTLAVLRSLAEASGT